MDKEPHRTLWVAAVVAAILAALSAPGRAAPAATRVGLLEVGHSAEEAIHYRDGNEDKAIGESAFKTLTRGELAELTLAFKGTHSLLVAQLGGDDACAWAERTRDLLRRWKERHFQAAPAMPAESSIAEILAWKGDQARRVSGAAEIDKSLRELQCRLDTAPSAVRSGVGQRPSPYAGEPFNPYRD